MLLAFKVIALITIQISPTLWGRGLPLSVTCHSNSNLWKAWHNDSPEKKTPGKKAVQRLKALHCTTITWSRRDIFLHCAITAMCIVQNSTEQKPPYTKLLPCSSTSHQLPSFTGCMLQPSDSAVSICERFQCYSCSRPLFADTGVAKKI